MMTIHDDGTSVPWTPSPVPNPGYVELMLLHALEPTRREIERIEALGAFPVTTPCPDCQDTERAEDVSDVETLPGTFRPAFRTPYVGTVFLPGITERAEDET